MTERLQEEIRRKLFHLLTLIYVAGYWYLPRRVVLIGMGITIFLAFVIEVVRLSHRKVNRLVLLLGVHRKSEENNLSGLLWTLSGAFFTMYFFENPQVALTRNIVLASLLWTSVSDTSAAIVGTSIGKIKIGSKTLEGSSAYFLTALALGYFVLPWPVFLWGALLSTFFEAIKWPLNDNFWLPVLSAGALTQIMIRYGYIF